MDQFCVAHRLQMNYLMVSVFSFISLMWILAICAGQAGHLETVFSSLFMLFE